ncbi:MAG: tandem-95 repeat protein, partial [Pirellulaceae bacterium]|nr:tandem-95 repeat protein [Pirellulaceae bacterium]
RASDGTLQSDPVTVTITVTAVDDPPVALNDAYTMSEDQVLTVTAANGVLINDTDSDTPHANLTAVLVANPSHGTVTLNANGSFTYTPSANFAGTDTFTYRASDGTSNSSPATVTITVLNVADPPVAVNDSLAVVNTGATHVLNVLANDYDPDPGDAITLVSVTQGSSGGAVAVSGGSVNYTPTTGFVGQETFTYTIRDNDGQQATATVTVTVTADTSAGNASIAGFAYLDANGDGAKNTVEVGIPGVLVTLTGTTTGGSSVTRTVLTGDDGSFVFANLAAGTYSLAETQPAALKDGLDSASDTAAVVGNDSIGNIVLAAGQARTGYLFGEQALLTKYVTIRMFLASTPPTEVWLREVVACGEDDAGNDDLAAQIRDGSQTIENVAPVAVANSYSTTQGTTLTVNAASGVLANDTDADGDTLSAILVTGPASGTLSLAANGSFTYVPTASFTGTVSFTYRAQDGVFSSNIATVTITVQATAAAPTAVNNAYSVNEDNTLTVATSTGVLANDTDPNGDSLSAVLVAGASHGTVSLAANGSFTYTPSANYHGTDTFTYRATDGSLTSNTATVTITVNPVNDEPVGVANQYAVATNETLTVAAGNGVLANDTDVDGDQLQANLVTGVSHGTLSLNANGSFVYTPAADFNGVDTFVYKVYDGETYSGETTVTLVVNRPAVVQNDAYSVERNNVLTVEAANGVLANDADLDADALTAVLATGPSNGVLVLNADGSFTYTPNAGFHGTDTFTYAAEDGLPNPSLGTVTITVTKINHAPVGLNDLYTVAVNETLTVDVANGILANDTDLDGDSLVAHLFSYASHGAVSFNTNGSFVYTPNEDFQGTDTFVYKVYDGETYSGETTVTITVEAVDEALAEEDDWLD